jgi:amino acid transporter
MGASGALLIGVGAMLSMTGNLAGQILTGSRMLFALAEQGDLPKVFAAVHPTYRTPIVAILFTAGVALALALSGSFAWLAIASAVARLGTYAASCGAAIVLRRPSYAGAVGPALFESPGSPIIPALGTLVSLGLLAGATRDQLAAGAAAIGVGALLFVLARGSRRPSTQG